jgi:hypothetical protein
MKGTSAKVWYSMIFQWKKLTSICSKSGRFSLPRLPIDQGALYLQYYVRNARNRKEIPLVGGRGHASDQGGGHPGTRDEREATHPNRSATKKNTTRGRRSAPMNLHS